MQVKGGRVAQFSFSDDGSMVYAPGVEGAGGTLVWVDRKGTVETISAERRQFSNPRLSSDGKRLAIILWRVGASPDVWLYEFARDALTRFTFKLGMELSSAWTPDGKRVAFSSWYTNQGRSELRWKPADVSREESPTVRYDVHRRRQEARPFWSPADEVGLARSSQIAQLWRYTLHWLR